MNVAAVGMAVGGFAAVLVAWGTYLATIPRGKVPLRPVAWQVLQGVGVGLALAGIAWSLRGGGMPGVAVLAPAAMALMMGSLFFWIYSQRRTPLGKIQVKVGDTLLPFSLPVSDGSTFDSGSLANQRVLLKFFRGSW